MTVCDHDLALETLVVVGPFFVEQFVNRCCIKLLLGVLLQQRFEITMVLFYIGSVDCWAESS